MVRNTQNPDLHAVLEKLLATRHIARNITHLETIPPRQGSYCDFPQSLDARLVKALQARGIHKLYSHQVKTFEAVQRGKNVVIVTPTASGKTLCFNLPVVQRALENPSRCALYLYPTKALAQDQYIELKQLASALGSDIRLFTFDGDTPASARKAVRAAANVVLTNPDMLHTGILPNHTGWSRIFEQLDFVVIDEIHHYRGVFGSHVANVLRRLQRICDFYGSRPQFICCSATIANPREIAEKLCEREFVLIDENGAPSGEKIFIFYNPPVVNKELGIRRNVINEARRLATRFLAENIQTIVFARSRMRVELLVNYLRKTMRKLRRNPELIAGYRGGYLPNERRRIEQDVKSGEILGVVSTNALELGVDIGQLRAAILAGYPGSVASTWQQAGRAGRKAEAAVAVLVASSLPIDQYVITHPSYFFGKAPEMAFVNPNNAAILAAHIKCAVFELPFLAEERFGGIDPTPLLEDLANEHIVRRAGEKWYWSGETYPSENISLRSASAENFVVVNIADKNRVIAEVDYDSAPFLIHSEAIYLHLGEIYYIDRLDWERRTAFARPHKSDYYTEALAKTEVRILYEDLREEIHTGELVDASQEAALPPSREQAAQNQEYPILPQTEDVVPAAQDVVDDAHERIRAALEKKQPPEQKPSSGELDTALTRRSFGNVAVITIVAKYKKLRFETHENVGYGEVNLPPLQMQTESTWFCYDPQILESFSAQLLPPSVGLSGLEYLLTNIVPLYVLCDTRDVGVVGELCNPHTEAPTVFVYDKYPGGTGLARRVFDIYPTIFRAAYDLIRTCSCADGCPSCCGPPTDSGVGGKLATRRWLEAALGLWGRPRDETASSS